MHVYYPKRVFALINQIYFKYHVHLSSSAQLDENTNNKLVNVSIKNDNITVLLRCFRHFTMQFAVPRRKQRLDSAKEAELAVWFNARLHQRTFNHGRKKTKSCESGQQTSDQKRRSMMIMIMMNHRYRNH